MKKLILLAGNMAVVAAPIIATISCEDDNDKPKIAMIISTKNNPFFKTLSDAAEAEAKKRGYELKVYVSNDDNAKEASQIDIVIAQGFKTLILNGLDAKQSATNAQKAIDAGIKVIAVDRPLDQKAKVWTTVASNNQDGGQKLGEKVFKLFRDANINNFKMLHLQGISGEQNGLDRWAGFKAAQTAERTVAVTRIYEQRADYNRTKGSNKTQTAMTSDSTIKYINADNDEMALGAIQALGSKVGITTNKVIVTGFDGGSDAIKQIKAGKLFGTAKQNPALLGQKAVQAAIEASGGQDFKDIVEGQKMLVKTTVITKENVNQF